MYSTYMLHVTWVNVIERKLLLILSFCNFLSDFHITLRKHKSISTMLNILDAGISTAIHACFSFTPLYLCSCRVEKLQSSLSLGKLLVVSPHLDDAVFSCAEMIALHAGTLVVTVFSGAPMGFDQLTDWDAASGFLNAEEAISQRKQEDYAALHLLSALPLWLDFFDSQYNATPSVHTVASALEQVLQEHQPESVLFPAGLFHSDHLLVHQAMLALRHDHLEKSWMMYEDALYRRIPSLLQKRLAELLEAGIDATPMPIDDKDVKHLKHQAVHCYTSQLQALSRTVAEGHADAFASGRCWQLTQTQPNLSEAYGQH
jgi:LmbE family N-acetylglucosaminyl deacetylase